MGSCFSKSLTNDAEPDLFRAADIPSNLPHAIYPFNEHNESCRVLRPWQIHGEKSRNFRYVIYTINNNLLTKQQSIAQEVTLKHILQLASIHGLNVLVKCLDYSSDADHDPEAAKEQQLYMDMLAADFASDLVSMWDCRRPHPTSSRGTARILTSEERIDAAINKIRHSREIGDSDAKSQVEPELVAALSRFTQEWPLDEFLMRKDEICDQAPTVTAEGISKLQAQFILQTRVAYASLTSETGAAPTVAISFVPDEIPNITLTNIKRHLKTVFDILSEEVNEFGKAMRHDLYTIQLISLGTTSSRGGGQWNILDGLGQRGGDIIDHLHLDCNALLTHGPGPFLGQKIMLGSIEPEIDRVPAGGSATQEFYGNGGFPVTKEHMEECFCQKKPAEAYIVR
ncbi:uncharacterized protein CTRU02_215491 [Colletotrichum truncatum]|uniref:Uncharacterized protein n=1 Tax=Colletotrichum truncatum TaxID=5467 RepID=A0ACC3YCR9_COLTU|nr:uncharacterized protein CTRU02_05565 [Colletotrichum truncatum]KAF6794008.1 hypothetical protein CTRU02_05565 [Colletotrichum truncatum]